MAPRGHLLNLRDLQDSDKIGMPQTRGVNRTFETAPRVAAEVAVGQLSLPDGGDGDDE